MTQSQLQKFPNNIMVMGYDAYHDTKSRGGRTPGSSVGAVVATMNSTFTKYYSQTSIINTRDDLAQNLQQQTRGEK